MRGPLAVLASLGGVAIAGGGDVDGDGYDDLIVSETLVSYSRRKVQVYRGGPGGIATTPAATLRWSEYYDRIFRNQRR